jgi:hypothetical protein
MLWSLAIVELPVQSNTARMKSSELEVIQSTLWVGVPWQYFNKFNTGWCCYNVLSTPTVDTTARYTVVEITNEAPANVSCFSMGVGYSVPLSGVV